MEIIRHLSNEELTDLVIESDRQALRPTLEALPDWARTSTEQPEEFWQEQRAVIWSRISSLERHPQNRAVRRSLLLAGSAVAAMVLLAALMLDRASSIPPPRLRLILTMNC